MRQMVEPKFLYHLTEERWGKKVKLYPREDGFNRSSDEPDISRTCVSPDITRCFLALPYDNCTYFIYRTIKKTRAYYPTKVIDSAVTREKWLLSPFTFIRIGIIPGSIINKFPEEKTCRVQYQYKNLPTIRDILRRYIKKNVLKIPLSIV